VDQRAERAFIRAVAVGGVKTAKAVAAQSATAFGIQRKLVLEWRSTTRTEEFGAQRLRRSQAFPAYRDAVDLFERDLADSAIAREEKGKKGVGG
jgi:hypothetical protein